MVTRKLVWGILMMPLTISCTASEQEEAPDNTASRAPQPLDVGQIEQITGLQGMLQDGEYKIAVPQNDLNVSVDGFRIIPPMGLTTWAAFTPTPDGGMVMGDFVVLEDEVGPVQQTLIDGGLTVSALHTR